jgi:hypothetical protein
MDSEHDKLFCMGAAHDSLPWGPAIVCREYLKEVSRCMIQDVRDSRDRNLQAHTGGLQRRYGTVLLAVLTVDSMSPVMSWSTGADMPQTCKRSIPL